MAPSGDSGRSASVFAFIMCAVFLIVGAHAGRAGVNVWTTHGPYGDPVSALAIDPRTPSTLYAGTAGGGVFQSTNSAGSWSPVNSGLTDMEVNALAIDPLTPSTLYAGIRDSGVFQSTDSGGSWSAVNSDLPNNTYVYALAIDPRTPSTLYAGTVGDGVFQSTDSGGSWSLSWSPVNSGLTNNTYVYALAIDPSTPSTLYAGTAIDDLLTLVNMALGNGGLCPNGLAVGVTPDVSVILHAVNNSLNGCSGG
jgi:hypothetical protein